MFHIDETTFGEFALFGLVNDGTGEELSLLPGYGATPLRLILSDGVQLHDVLHGYTDPLEIENSKSYQGSKLFPFPNRIDQGRYSWKGKVHQLPVNFPPHAIHGLVHDKEFKVLRKEAGVEFAEVYCQLKFEGIEDYYPYAFLLEMTFRLDRSGFSCLTRVKNAGSDTMIMGDGWHPYFRIGDKRVDMLSLRIPPVVKLEVDDRMIPTGKELPFNGFLSEELIGSRAMDDGFRILSGPQKVETVLYDSGNRARISIWQENYPFLQIYTPPDRRSIALEPMTCATDAFNNGLGLIKLGPGKEWFGKYGVYLSK